MKFCIRSVSVRGFGLGGGVIHEEVVRLHHDLRELAVNCFVHLVIAADHLAASSQGHRLAHHELRQLLVLHFEVLALHEGRLPADRVQHEVQCL